MAILSGCSGDDDEGAAESTPAGDAASPTPVSGQPSSVQEEGDAVTPAGGVIEVEIQNAQFLQNDLLLPIGQSSTIRVTNSDTQKHNLRLAGLDGEYTTEDDAVAAPDGIAAGGTAELILAPAVPGQYTFRCDFHPGTMGGTVTAQ